MKLYLIATFLVSCNNPSGKEALTNSAKAVVPVNSIATVATKPDTVKSDTIPVTIINEAFIQQATVSKKDSVFWVQENIRSDYRIFGYAKPDTNSQKLIVFSVFTNDVANNPYQCKLGAHYGSNALGNKVIRYTGNTASFIQTLFIDDQKRTTTLYFERKWVAFTD